ncbi:RNA-directed DNA polymerase, eukaryota [Tanacetum coccineum]
MEDLGTMEKMEKRTGRKHLVEDGRWRRWKMEKMEEREMMKLFKREYMKGSVNVDKTKNESNKRKFDGSHKNVENTVIGKSFVSVVKTSRMPIDKESPPAIVLEDDCLNAKDLTLSLMGRVKEMASLVNLKKALCNEGFDVLRLAIWENLGITRIRDCDAKDSFRECVVWALGFSRIFIPKEFAFFLRVGLLGISRRERKTEFISGGNNDGRFIDLDGQINGLMRVSGRREYRIGRSVTEEDHSLSHPPGFTPEEGLNEGNTVNLDMKDYGENERDDNSFVNLMMVRYLLSLWAKLWVITWMGASRISLRSLNPKENLGLIDEFYVFERSRPRPKGQKRLGKGVVDSVGNSGGILCIWDPNSFRRSSFTRSDYFVIVRGVWLKSGIDLMIVVVYAPQEAKEKRMLWDYLAHVSNQWVGKLVMMGDFNEVRYKSDRYGSNFNAHDAEIFNSFIYNAGLDEVPLGGSAYTWCLKSASKMSKLDRFFVSENLLSMCPNITAITLERFISDHRPILLRAVRYDYGHIPFSISIVTGWMLMVLDILVRGLLDYVAL